ncbi:MAG TPA: hypothetical protein PKA26_06815, partial [bacterium]|nr:hypothetical protein [bacterium]
KEAVNNIYKYAEATEVVIRLVLKNKRIYLEVRDNGGGLKGGVTMGGHGMKNMKMRAETLGGLFQSSSDQGVTIRVEIPIRD